MNIEARHDLIFAELNKKNISPEISRMNFINAAIEADKEFKETGLHVTLDELNIWMESWGTDNELPFPICHT